MAAANIVTGSKADDQSFPITPNDLKPRECSALNLTNLIIGSVNIQGTSQNDLILGSAIDDRVNAKQGNDCVFSGDGNDILRGMQNNDILIGGAGDDDLQGDKGTDVCYGGLGTDASDGTCETEYSIP
jgi:Ca2+-binding RTX toxin-like protein